MPNRSRRCRARLAAAVYRRPTVAGAVEVEYDLSRRKAKKVKKILEHKDISLTDTPPSMKSHIITNTVDNPAIRLFFLYCCCLSSSVGSCSVE